MKIDDNEEIKKTSIQDSKVFEKLCQLASFGLFEVTKDIEEAGTGEIYSDGELKLIRDQVSRLEDIFVKKLFGHNPMLSKLSFVKSCSELSTHFLDSSHIRFNLLQLADIKERHYISKQEKQ